MGDQHAVWHHEYSNKKRSKEYWQGKIIMEPITPRTDNTTVRHHQLLTPRHSKAPGRQGGHRTVVSTSPRSAHLKNSKSMQRTTIINRFIFSVKKAVTQQLSRHTTSSPTPKTTATVLTLSPRPPWFNLSKSDSPAAKAFYHVFPNVSVKDLSAIEQQYMEDYLFQQLPKITSLSHESSVHTQCKDVLKRYQSTLMIHMPKTMAYLKKHQEDHSHNDHSLLLTQTTPALWGKNSSPASATIEAIQKLHMQCAADFLASPFEKQTVESFEQQATRWENYGEQFNELITSVRHDPLLPQELQHALIEDMQSQQERIQTSTTHLIQLSSQSFANAKNLKEIMNQHTQTALLVLKERMQDLDFSQLIEPSTTQAEKYRKQIKECQALEAQLHARLSELTSHIPYMSVAEFSQHIKKDKKQVKQILKYANIPKKKLKILWNSSWNKVSNNTPWTTIDKTLLIRHKFNLEHYKSQNVPAAAMRLNTHHHHLPNSSATRDPFQKSYNGRGIASTTKNRSDHALNLHQTKFVKQEVDDSCTSQPLFSGIRSGTIASQQLDISQQKSAKKAWAEEIVTAALIDQFERSEVLKHNALKGAVTPLRLVSTSLLTPDLMRHATHIHDDERTLQAYQYQALQEMHGTTMTVLLYDSQGKPCSITVELEVVTLNIPVNTLALDPLLSKTTPSWKEADCYNDQGFHLLLGNPKLHHQVGGWTAKWLNQNPEHPDREKVLQLSTQIKDIYNKKQHHRVKGDAHKLVTRVQLLAHLIGATPHFGCKSGKDRTGEVDSHTKALAWTVDHLGYVPEPNTPWDRERKEALQAIMHNGGSPEILLRNSGNFQLKTKGNQTLEGSMINQLHL